ncbi:MAG: glycosyltransferase family 4 protein [Desulfobacteraceae bacterium]|nr:glycosyltransferase family 4 protein [Desulfobacteraceae bacterium]MBC2756802.1 glycosyltransferase family 4 protein [Desulfobacteraceae bacterium]
MDILKLCYEYPPLGGGGGHVVQGLSKHLVRQGHHVDLITMDYKGLKRFEKTGTLFIHRIKCIRSGPIICHPHEMLSYLLAAFPKALMLSRKKQYDMIHAHFIFPDGILAYLVSKFTGLPYIITAHGSDVPGFNPDRFVNMHDVLAPVWKEIVRTSSRVICLSHYLESLLKNKMPLASTTIIPNGFPIGRFRSGRSKLNRILTVTRMFKRKGVQYFLNALDGLNLNHEIHIVGDGPYLSELKQLSKLLSLDVVFHGFIKNDSEQFTELMETSKIFVLPSDSDNFPISLLEAMDAGMAIITTRHTGCEEVVANAGFLVEPGDVIAIREALVSLTENPSLCRKSGEMARKRLDEHFSWPIVAKQYIKIYEEIGR